jgi:tRNA(Met) cytidine acetyltransferase
VSTAFGASLDLLKFWQRSGFQFANLSLQAEVSSGEHSAQWVYPLSSAAQKSVQNMQGQIAAELAFHSDKSLSNLPPSLLSELLRQQHQATDFSQMHFIEQFIAKSRPFSQCQRILREFILRRISQVCTLPYQQHDVLVMLLLQGKSFQYVSDHSKLTGKQQIEQCVRDALLKLLHSPLV